MKSVTDQMRRGMGSPSYPFEDNVDEEEEVGDDGGKDTNEMRRRRNKVLRKVRDRTKQRREMNKLTNQLTNTTNGGKGQSSSKQKKKVSIFSFNELDFRDLIEKEEKISRKQTRTGT